jgi:RHS repeat-associated protein
LAEANLYRFSSKEYHPSSGLVYYLYRHYEPNLQRWLNRDPIGELGGLNLYGYVSNDPLDRYDPFGEADAPKDQPPVTSPPIFGEKTFKPGTDNCLCYALDRPGGPLQPDGGDGRSNAKKCADLMKQIKATFKGVGDVPKGGNCPSGSHKIAVFADGDGGYHVQRQDSGGDWSEMSLNPTYPPRKCKKGGNSPGKSCGDLCAPDQPKLASPSPSR